MMGAKIKNGAQQKNIPPPIKNFFWKNKKNILNRHTQNIHQKTHKTRIFTLKANYLKNYSKAIKTTSIFIK